MKQYRDLRPDDTRPVKVLVGGTWFDGELEAYRLTDDDVWEGWVRWMQKPGYQYIGWYPESQVQRGEL